MSRSGGTGREEARQAAAVVSFPALRQEIPDRKVRSGEGLSGLGEERQPWSWECR